MKRLSLLLALSLLACGDDDSAADAAASDAPARDTSGDDAARGDATADDAMVGDSALSDSGMADAPGTDAGDDASAGSECTVDTDCMMVSDCCACGAAPTGTPVEECELACIQPLCQAAGIDAVSCKAGVCVLQNVECDESRVTCDTIPPECDAGATAHIVDGCYSGLCVPVEACRFVAGCDDCTAAQTCVTFATMMGPRYTCAPTPASCGDTPDCACLGDEICEEPYECSPGATLSCVCPRC